MDRARLAEVFGSLGGDGWSCGSGYLVADRLVLTAAHVVRDAAGRDCDQVRVRLLAHPAGLAEAAVRWARYDGADEGVDAALVEITDPGWTPPAGLAPMRWGVLAGDDPGVRVQVVGFPDSVARPGHPRDVDQVGGVLNPLSGTRAGRHHVVVESWPKRTGRGGSGWSGISGGPVSTAGNGAGDGLLLGAVVVDPGHFESRRLTAVPVAAVLADEAAVAVLLAHGAATQTVPYGSDPDRAPAGLPCPYPGLVAFGTEDAAFFRGRERLTATLLTRLALQVRRGGLLVVIGPSGAGKSSLLRAGLLPAVAAGDLPVEGSAAWPQLYLRPGTDPVAELVRQVGALGISTTELSAAVRTSATALRDALRQALAAAPALAGSSGAVPTTDLAAAALRHAADARRVVMVVDQVEELFTLGCTEDDRLTTVRALLAACEPAGGQPAPAVVVLGVRADFYAHCARIPELVPHLQDCQVLVGPMTREEQREAITGPAEAAGLLVEDGLTDLLLADATGESLPLLAHALRRTFAHRRGRTLTVAGYRATGGIAQAVATTAEAVYDTLDAADRDLLRQFLLAMVSLGDGVEDTRRRVPRDELLGSNAQRRQAGEGVLARLVEERLVTAERDSYMLSHEALIHAWPRLSQWLTEDRDGLRVHRELGNRARTWERLARDPTSLYGGAELELARRWGDSHPDDLDDLEQDFYQASVAAAAAEQRIRARRTRFLYAAAVTLTVLLVLALTAGAIALQQRHAADTAARTALARQLAAQSDSLINTDPDLASLLAVQSYRTEPTDEGRRSLTAAANLPLQRRLTGHTDRIIAVAFSPNGTTLATTSDDHTARLWNTHTGTPIATLTGHTSTVRAVAFSPDGTTLATASDDHTARLWNAHTGRPLATLTGHTGTVWAVAFSPDGTTLATASYDYTARLWNAHTGRPLATLTGHTDWVNAVAFSPDGTTLATASYDYTARLWNTHTGTPIATLTGHTGTVWAVAFSPDGTTLATTSTDHTARLWNTHTGTPIATLTGHTSTVWAVAFSPDGTTLATASGDHTARLWNARTGRPLATLTGHTDWVNAVAFSPDGTTLATASGDHTARLWNAHTGTPLATLTGHTGTVRAVAFSRDGTTLATTNDDGTARLWNTHTGTPIATLTGHTSTVRAVAFSPDGTTLATASGDHTARLWNTHTGTPIATLTGHTSTINAVAFSPDGTTLATASDDHTARLWNAHTGTPLATLTGHTGTVRAVAFSRDGTTLATTNDDGTARLWNTHTGTPIATLTGHTSTVRAVAFSPDGTTLATASGDHTARLWNTHTGTPIATLTGHTSTINAVAFSPDGTTLATASDDHTARLWNAHTGTPLATLTGHTGTVRAVAFSRDGTTLATASGDHTARLWNAPLGPTKASRQVCDAIGRDLSQQEWSLYLPGRPYERTCQH